jgi:WD40-like Beta Propeller Repeat
VSLDELAREATDALLAGSQSRFAIGPGASAVRRTVGRRRVSRMLVAATVVLALLVGTFSAHARNAQRSQPVSRHHAAAILVKVGSRVLAVDPLTGAARRLVIGPGDETVGDLIGASPDGTQLVYQLGPRVCVADLWSAKPRSPSVLPLLGGWQVAARWTSDTILLGQFSTSIAVSWLSATYREGAVTSERRHAVAGNLGTSTNVLPSWSPDGTRVAFSAMDRAGRRHLYVMDADGTSLREIDTGTGAGVGQVSWSPDGSRIAYTDWDDSGALLMSIRPDGTARTVIARAGDSVEGKYVGMGIAWAPDSRSIAFLAQNLQRPGWSLYVTDLTGAVRRLPVPGVTGFTLAWAAGR